jgi:hypothetical protein
MSFGNVPGIPLLDCDHQLAHIRCRYLVDGFVAISGKHVSLHAPHGGVGVSRRLADLPPLPPLTSDILEAVLCFTLSGFGLLLLGLSLGFALGHRIDPVRQCLARFRVSFPRLFQTYKGILPKCHHLFLAVNAIPPAPEFGTGRWDKKTEAAAICEFV